MSLRISGKHMEIGDAFRLRIQGRLGEVLDKYFDGGFSGRVTVEKAGSRFLADCMIHLDSGAALQGTGQAQDPQIAFETAADRVEKRLRRYKRRLKAHPASKTGSNGTDIAYRVMSPPADEDEEIEIDEDYAPVVVAESSLPLKTMTVASAVVELDTKESPVFVFRNAGNDHVNIVYRRADGNIGWIDPSAVQSRHG